MVQMRAHGGHCCGMYHIHGFREATTDNYIQDLIQTTERNGMGNGRYQLEVILSDLQTRENPRLVDALARLGYVYTSSWTGQHYTPIHQFLRARYRLALSAANFYNRWVNDLNGMLPHPDLFGVLPPLQEAPPLPNNGRLNRHHNYLQVGDRVRVNSPRSQLHGTEQVIQTFHYVYNSGGYYATFEDLPRGQQIIVTNLIKIEDAPAVPAFEPLTYRHPTNPVGWPEPAAAPTVPARRLILSQFYCVFRATGQASRVFSTLAEGQEAYPQALDWHERKVYSDGEIVEGPVNHG